MTYDKTENHTHKQKDSNVYGARTYLTLGNHTQIDLHIQVTGDVHTGNWGPKQVNNNESPEVKSRRVDYGNEATYNIKVWKNDSGQPGKEIGSFEHQVRLNAVDRDHLEFTIITQDDKTYMRVFSTRKALEIALILILG